MQSSSVYAYSGTSQCAVKSDADWSALIASYPEVATAAANLAPVDVDFVAQQPLYNLTVAKYVRYDSARHVIHAE